MAINFGNPVKEQNVNTGVLQSIRDHQVALAKMLEGETITGGVSGIKRIDGGYIEEYNGSTWAKKAMGYVDRVATSIDWSGNPTHGGAHTWTGAQTWNAANSFVGTSASPIVLNRTSTAANTSIGYQNTSGTVYAGHGAANTFAIKGATNLDASPWWTHSATAMTSAATVVTWSGNPTHSGNHTWSGTSAIAGVTAIGNLTNVPAFSTTDILRVGGSTSTSNAGVQVNAGANTGLSYLHFGDPDARDPAGFQYNHGTDTMVVRTGGASRVTLSSSLLAITPNTSIAGTLGVTGSVDFDSTLAVTGTLTASGAIRGASGSAATPEYSFVSSTNMGMYRASSSSLRFSVAGGDVLNLSSGGDVATTGVLTVGGTAIVTGGQVTGGGSILTLSRNGTSSVSVTAQASVEVFIPSSDNTTRLGNASNRWSVVYAATGSINTSDERQKDVEGETQLGLEFIRALRPIQYRWKQGGFDQVETGAGDTQLVPRAGARLFHGFSAQQVKASLPEDVDFAGWTLGDKDDPESVQGLRYTEFIAPIVKAIQQLDARLSRAEQRLH